MDLKEYSSNSLSFIGDAVFTLRVRQYFIENHYQASASLQKLCNGYNSAKGQTRVFHRLEEEGFFTDEELEVYKRGRNHITHIPKNGDRLTYECASGLEAVCGYLYLSDPERLEVFFEKVFEGGTANE
ncbi:MAG: Mini-ribonuclease 3 [Erysipelotrichaceae bacterium]|jgi:ribonuclease-3 family protein|nr:Mini-ribonuclease 3 [Erysipelotrichaceae bacterium]